MGKQSFHILCKHIEFDIDGISGLSLMKVCVFPSVRDDGDLKNCIVRIDDGETDPVDGD